ncbi:MAG: hypothetical protein Q9198_002115 [Flavoplaca austrocitrina]
MTTVTGKRKRRVHIAQPGHSQDAGEQAADVDRLRALLRQHFEQKFESLESSLPASRQDHFPNGSLGADDDSTDWNGISDEDGEEAEALVVDYQNTGKNRFDSSREDLKRFMSAKPPIEDHKSGSSNKQRTTDSQDLEETATDAANLKKDLALERLLQESHLLDPKSSLTPSGRDRHKAIDVRQQALGSRTSVFAQKKMPLAQRRGIMAKSTEREQTRRREAKDSGIILEKTFKPKTKDPRRERGIGAPSVGRFSRGMLSLSKRDVNMIVGPAKRSKQR